MAATNVIGKSISRVDAEDKLRGSAIYAADVRLPHMHVAKFLTSPHSHAEILSIDTAEAEALPGVAGVITAADIPEVDNFDPNSRAHAFLARRFTVFAGQPIVAVAAENADTAEAALALVTVEYNPLPAVLCIAEAIRPHAPTISREIPSNSATNIDYRHVYEHGNLEASFAEADVVVEHTYRLPMVHQGYIEPQAVTAHWDRYDHVAVWTATQAIFEDRLLIADVLGLSANQVTINSTEIGGGFGGKYQSPLLPLTVLLARKAGCPVQLVMTRFLEFTSVNPAPVTHIRLKVGSRRDGTLLGLDCCVHVDVGAFPIKHHVSADMAINIHENYNFRAWRMEALEVLTNKVSTGAYRAPGAPHAFFAIESHLDTLARTLDLDPVVLRRRNLSLEGDLEFDARAKGQVATDKVLSALTTYINWNEPLSDHRTGWLRGRGVALGSWGSSGWPAAANAILEANGLIRLVIGTVDLTGSHTALAQIAAEALEVPTERIIVSKANTDYAPFAPVSGGSRTVYSMGMAVEAASKDLRNKMLARAGEMLEVDSADLQINNTGITVIGSPEHIISFDELYRSGADIFSVTAEPLIGYGATRTETFDLIAVGTVAEVAVDPDTGFVVVERLVTAQDVGKAINPKAVQGQIQGAAVQGLGLALTEAIHYNDFGHMVNADLSSYCLPRSTITPTIETVLLEEPGHGPFGAKGVGEPPITSPAAAIANAVADAIGVSIFELPLTPECVWRLMNDVN